MAQRSTARRALVIVCVQNDFCSGGSLEVSPKANDDLVARVNALKSDVHWDLVVLTYDWHPLNHCSFWQNHPSLREGKVVQLDNRPQVMWPQHCVQGSHGSRLHPQLAVDFDDVHVHCGVNARADSYSGFGDKAFSGEQKDSLLSTYLLNNAIQQVYCCGLATDVCVQYTLIDSVSPDVGESNRRFQFESFFVVDGSQAITPNGHNTSLENFRIHGVGVVAKAEIAGERSVTPLEDDINAFGKDKEHAHQAQRAVIRALTDAQSTTALCDRVAAQVEAVPPSTTAPSPKTGRTLLHELCRLSTAALNPLVTAYHMKLVQLIVTKCEEALLQTDAVTHMTPVMFACAANNPALVRFLFQQLENTRVPFDERSVPVPKQQPTNHVVHAESLLRLLFSQIDQHRTGMVLRQALCEMLETSRPAGVSLPMANALIDLLAEDDDVLVDVDALTQTFLRLHLESTMVNQDRRASVRLEHNPSLLGEGKKGHVFGQLCARETHTGMTPLMIACQAKNKALVDALLAAADSVEGYRVPFILSHTDLYGRSPLMHACEAADADDDDDKAVLEVLYDLVETHAKLESFVAWELLLRGDNEGWTFLHYCSRKGFAGIVSRVAECVDEVLGKRETKFGEWLVARLVHAVLDPVHRGFNLVHLVAWNQETLVLRPVLNMLKTFNALGVARDTLTTWGWGALDLALHACVRTSTTPAPLLADASGLEAALQDPNHSHHLHDYHDKEGEGGEGGEGEGDEEGGQSPRAAAYKRLQPFSGAFHRFEPQCALLLVREGFVPVRTRLSKEGDHHSLCYDLLVCAYLTASDESYGDRDARQVLVPLLCKPEFGVVLDDHFIRLVHVVRHHNRCTERSVLSASEVRGGLTLQPIFHVVGGRANLCVVCALGSGEPVMYAGLQRAACTYARRQRVGSQLAKPVSKAFKEDIVLACLINASRAGDDRLVQSLLPLSRPVPNRLRFQQFATPLHAAATFGHIKVAKRLLRTNEAMLRGQHSARTKVIWLTKTDAMHRTAFHIAAYKGNKELCNLILKFTGDLDRRELLLKRDAKGLTPLHLAVLSGDLPTVDYICGELINSPDIRGINDLYGAATTGGVIRVAAFQRVSVVWHTPSGMMVGGRTVRDERQSNADERQELLELKPRLLRDMSRSKSELGGDNDEGTEYEELRGSFVIHKLTEEEIGDNGHPQFHPDFFHYGLQLVRADDRWEVADRLNHMWTPLHLAVWTGQLEVAKVLLEYRADPTWRAPLLVDGYVKEPEGLRRLFSSHISRMPSALDLAIGEMRHRRNQFVRVMAKRDSSWISLESAFKRIKGAEAWQFFGSRHWYSSYQWRRTRAEVDTELARVQPKPVVVEATTNRLPTVSARHRKRRLATDAEMFHLAESRVNSAVQLLDTMYTSQFVKNKVDWKATVHFLRSTAVYIVLLIGFMFVAFPKTHGVFTNDAFPFTNMIRQNFENVFRDLDDSNEAFVSFLKTDLPIFAEIDTYGDTHVLGPVRLRQVRFEDQGADCVRVDQIANWDYPCSRGSEIKTDMTDQFQYGGQWHAGEGLGWRDYGTGGYIVDLPVNAGDARDVLAYLDQAGWFSNTTSIVFVDVTLYSPKLNMLGVARLARERLRSGATLRVSYLTTVSLFNEESRFRTRMPSLTVKVLMSLLLVGLLFSEAGELVDMGLKRYLVQPWNMYDLLIGCIVIVVLGLDTAATTRARDLGDIDATSSRFVDFFSPAFLISMERDMVALVVVACFVRLLKYLKLAPFVGPTVIAVMDTMAHASVIIFGMVLFVFILAFSFAYTVAIGWNLGAVSTVAQAFASLYTVAAKVDVDANLRSNWTTYLLFYGFTIFNMLVLFNLLIALISTVYPTKQHQSETNWRRIIFEAMENDIPQYKDPGRHTRPGKNRVMGVVRRLLELPSTAHAFVQTRVFLQFPHNWRYGDYTGEVEFEVDDEE